MSDAAQGARDPCVGTVLGERYLVTRVLGVGGMATLYVAQHTLIGRMVAIKLLHYQFARDQACVQRFLNEGRAAGTLGHPNIVESTDMGFAPDGSPFLVLELLEGVNLAVEIARLGAFSPERAAGVAAQVASALEAAHARQIIHRDLKPENIFLIATDHDHDHVKVLDFGISKFRDRHAHATENGVVMGTPDFMAPEQITAPDAIDQRIDVYALGSILYTMLVGRAPFADVPFPLIFSKIQTDAPPPLHHLRADLPAPFAAIVERAMARAPEHRHQTMGDLLLELLPFVGPTLPPSLVTPRRTPGPRLGAAERSGLGVGTPAAGERATPTGERATVDGRSTSTPTAASATGSADTLPSGHTPRPAPAAVADAATTGVGGATPAPIIVARRSPWLVVAVVLSLLATAATIVAVLLLRERVGARAPALAAAATTSPDTAVAVYLDEAERLLGERRYAAARAVLAKAARVDGASAALDVRMTRLREATDVGELRGEAQAALAAGDQARAAEAARRILDLLPGDAEATALVDRARAAPPTATAAIVDAGPPPVATTEPARPALPARATGPRSAVGEPARIAQVTPPASPPRTPTPVVDAGVRSVERPPVTPAVPEPPVAVVPSPPRPPVTRVAPPIDAGVAPAADEIRAPRLPETYRVSSIKDLTRVLSIVEQEAIDRGGAPPAAARGATSKLGQSLFDAFVPGVVIELRPGAMYYAIVRGARAGRGRDQIGSELRSSRFYRTI